VAISPATAGNERKNKRKGDSHVKAIRLSSEWQRGGVW